LFSKKPKVRCPTYDHWQRKGFFGTRQPHVGGVTLLLRYIFWGMKKIAYVSFVWLWVANLLVATVGVSLHRVYCHCTGQTRTSLLTHGDPACSHDRHSKPDCCQKTVALPTCCAADTDTPRDCTDERTEVFQLHVDFLVKEVGLLELPDFQSLADAPTSAFYFWGLKNADFESAALRPPPHAPPALAGRLRCIRLGCFRC
jgi:hypothetical protein